MSNYWDNMMATDEGAASYMETYGEGPGCETRIIIGEFINDGETVLDIGCGPGWNYDHFKEYGPEIGEYKGLDYSERFVRVANQRAGKEVFALGDVRNPGEDDKSWDVVILQDVLEHTSGYEKPMQEALRIARKRVIVTFWRGQMRDDYENDNGEDMIRDDGEDGFCGEYSRSKWEKYLDNLGYHWLETQTSAEANRWHAFFIIDKEEPHGDSK